MREQPVSVSLNENRNRESFPSWFINPPDAVVGIGLARFSAFNSQKSYSDALAYAIEDLNSNSMSVVTVEQFRNGASIQFQEEVAITDQYSESNVVKLDSVIAGDYVFYLVGTTPMQISSSGTDFMPLLAPVQIPVSEILNGVTSTQVHGEHERLSVNPYVAWALSKQNALKRLGLYTATKIQSLQKVYNEDLDNISYLKSRVALRNIRVRNRWLESGEFQTLIEVNNEDIINLTD